jgi:hypothetical protein
VRGLDCGGEEWVTAGEDGRVHLVSDGGDGRVVARRVCDGKGMLGYEAARWASSAEFATGGAGCGVQWWDRRKGDAVVAQCKGIWSVRSRLDLYTSCCFGSLLASVLIDM